jgi:hypothetical protein
VTKGDTKKENTKSGESKEGKEITINNRNIKNLKRKL